MVPIEAVGVKKLGDCVDLRSVKLNKKAHSFNMPIGRNAGRCLSMPTVAPGF